MDAHSNTEKNPKIATDCTHPMGLNGRYSLCGLASICAAFSLCVGLIWAARLTARLSAHYACYAPVASSSTAYPDVEDVVQMLRLSQSIASLAKPERPFRGRRPMSPFFSRVTII